MRILMVSDVYFPRINGVSTSIQTFRQEFESLGHEVFLIAPDYLEPYPPDDHIIRISSRGVLLDPEDRMMKYRHIINSMERLRELELDLVHIHTPFVAHYAGVKIAKVLGIPCALTYHTLFEEYLYHYIPFLPKQLLRAFTRRFSRTQCEQADAVIAPSSVIVELLQRYGVTRDIAIIPTGIHCDKFNAGDGDRFRQRFSIKQDRRVILNVSRVAFEKNIGMLLKALDIARQHVPEVLLVIAGEGPAKKYYVEQAQQMGLDDHVLFVGYLDRNTELIDCYHAADLFVFASKTETQGLVLLEAMAARTPVLSVAAMGTKDILNGCAGAQISEDNAEDFAARLIHLLKDRHSLQTLMESAESSAREWDSTALARRMLKFYGNVLRQKEKSALRSLSSATNVD